MKNLYENLCFAIGLVLVGSTFVNENPVLSNNTSQLHIPSVEAADQAGLYQDINLVFDNDNQLRMDAVKRENFSGNFTLASDNHVE